MTKSRKRTWWAWIAVAVCGLVVLAGCGSSDDSSSDSTSTPAAASTGSTAAPAADSGVAAAAAQVKEFTGLPEFKAPGPEFDAKKIMAGKTIVGIPVISSNPFTTNLEAEQAELAKKIGFKYIRWNNKGTVAEWTKGIDYAISQKASLIALDGGVQPKLLGPAIKKAQAAGIIVIDTHQTADAQGKSPNVDFTIPAPYAQAGELMANYAIAESEGKANALIITSSDVLGSPPFVDSIQQTFKKNCPDCKTMVTDVTVADWTSGIGPAVTGALQRDPDLNFILPIYDPEVQYVVPALRQAQKLGKVKIATFAGTDFVLKNIQQGIVQMDVGENLVGYSMLDDEMRLIGKMDPAFPEYLPTRVFTKDNIGSGDTFADYGSTATEQSWFDLWGLS
jgi:ribose transport system substrate-binding protein